MIRLEVYRQADGGYTGFSCSGHAGYGAYGQDIVCAGVSALATTAANSIETLTSDVPTVTANEKSGNLRCVLAAPASKEAALLIDALVLGCQTILETYGKEYITITFKEV